MRRRTISRVRLGFDVTFFSEVRVAVINPGWASDGAVAFAKRGAGSLLMLRVGVNESIADSWLFESGVSEDGGSEPTTGLHGVRKGDLKGLVSVLLASSSRRRFACGVDMLITACADE